MNLEELYLNDTNLSGPIPRELGQLVKLKRLWYMHVCVHACVHMYVHLYVYVCACARVCLHA